LLPPSQDGAGWLPARFVAELVRQSWPGNVRQLRNAAERFALENRDALRGKAPAHAKPDEAPRPTPRATLGSRDSETPAEVEREAPSDATIRRTLDESDNVISRAAKKLGMPAPTLHRHLKNRQIKARATDLPAETVTTAFEECNRNVGETAKRLGVSERALKARLKALTSSNDSRRN
jgi:DNA-binding NtrC family response regulator